MGLVTWVQAGGGAWSTAANWSAGRAPKSTDAVAIALPGTITLVTSVSVASLTLANVGAVLAPGPAAGTLSGAVLLQAGTVALGGGNLTLPGAVTFGQATASGGSIDGPGTLTTASASLLAGGTVALTLGGGAVWLNTGMVIAAGTIGLGDLSGASASIVNQAGAVFDLTTATVAIVDDGVINTAGTFTLGGGSFANAGTLEQTGGGGTDLIYAAVSNAGLITATSGTLELAGGGVLGGSMGGTGGGLVALGSGVFTLGATRVSLAGSLGLIGGEILLAGGQTLSLTGSVLLGQALVGGGGVDGPGTFSTSGATSILADGSPQIFLGDGVTWINTGSVAVASAIAIGDLSGNRASLVNAAGGSMVFTADTGGILDDGYLDAQGYYWQGSGTLANAGLLAKTGGTATSEVDAVLTNTGTVTVSSGTLDFDGGGVLGGSMGATAAGTLALGGGYWSIGGSRMTLTGPVDLTAGGIAIAAGQSLSLTGGATLGSGELFGPGTLSTAGVTAANGITLNDGLVWRNGGTLEMTGNVIFADIASTLTNLAGATIAFSSDAGDIFDAGRLSNAGLIAKTGGSGTNYVTATLLANTGSITASIGTLALEGGGVLSGAIGGTAGGVVALGGGSFSLSGPSFLAGTLALAGATVDLTAGQTLQLSSGAQFYGGAVDGAGTLATIGSVSESGLTLGGGVTWVNNGTATLSAALAEGDASGRLATIVNQAGAALLLATDQAGFGIDALATLSSAGLLEKSGGAGTSQIGVVLSSTGSIDVASGTLALDNGFSLVGQVGGAGTLALAGGAGLLGAGLALNISGLLIDGASVSVGGNLTMAGSFDLASGELAIGAGDRLSLTGNATLGAGTLDGPGTLATTGSTSLPLASQAGVVLAGVWANGGVATLLGSLLLGDGNGAGWLVNSATLVLAAATASIVANPGAQPGGVANSGLLSVAGGGAISAGLTSSGTLAIAGGVLALEGSSTLSGTVTGAGTLALDGGATTLSTGLVLGLADLLVNGGTLVAAASVGDANPVTLMAGTLWLDSGAVLSLADLRLGPVGWGGVAISGPGTLALTGSTSLSANGVAPLSTGGGAVWLNSGTLSLFAALLANSGAAAGATLINQAGASLLIASDTAGLLGAPGAFTLQDNGLLAKTGGTGTSHLDATIGGSGTISAGIGTLELDGGGVLAGQLGGTGGWVTIGAGRFTVGSVAPSVTGAFGLTGGTLALGSGQRLTLGGPASLAGGIVDGLGTLLLESTTLLGAADSFTLGGDVTLRNDGRFVVAGTLQAGDTYGNMPILLNEPGAVLNLTGGALITSYAQGSPTLLNRGLLDQTVGAGTIAAAVTNNGTILASGGTLSLLASLLNATGTLEVSNGATLQVTTFGGPAGTILVGQGGGTVVAPLSFSTLTANLILDGTSSGLDLVGGQSIEQTLTGISAGGILNLAAGRSYRSALSLVDAGLLILQGGTLATAGLTIAAGGVLAGTGTIGALISNAGTIEARFGLLQLICGSNGLLQIDPTGTLALAASVAGCVSFASNAGTLELAAAAGSIGSLRLMAGDIILLPATASARVMLTANNLSIVTGAGSWTASLAGAPTALRATTSQDAAGDTLISFSARMPVAPDDFTGSGASGLLLRNSNGSLAIWNVTGLSSAGGAVLGNPGATWQVAGVGDFTGTGNADVLLQTGAGYVELWELQGATPMAMAAINAPGGGWRVAATGDFNGDGVSDIVWQNGSLGVAVWEMNGAVPITTAILGNPGSLWLVAGVVNLGTAGSNEILLQNAAGDVGLWQVDGVYPGAVTEIGSPGPGWHLAGAVAVGNGDLASLVWQNAADEVAVWEVGAAGPVAGADLGDPGAGWQVCAVGSDGSGGVEITLQTAQGGVMAWTAQGTSLTGSALLGNPGTAWTVVNP